MSELFARIAGRCAERPAAVIAAAALLALIAGVGATRLEPDAGTDRLVDSNSPAFTGTERLRSEFGDDPVVVLVEGDLEQLVLTSAVGKLLSLEACLAGNAPEQIGGALSPEPCSALAEQRPARVVFGPATLLDQFATQAVNLLGQQSAAARRQAQAAATAAQRAARRRGLSEVAQSAAANAASARVLGGFQRRLVELALRYGQSGIPRIDDPNFVRSVVFDPENPGQPKPRFAYLFPSSEAALITIRLRPELSESERREAIDLMRAAVADPAFEIRDTQYVVSGVPVIVEGLAEKISSEIFLLLGAALAVMALVLALILGPPLRLLPLALALGSAAVVFGLFALVGGTLTMASLAVLPVLIGLAVDYAIQFQARFVEASRAGATSPRAAIEAAARGGRVIATAAIATAAGFLVLVLSPIPMVRDFGLLLVAGIAIAFVLALTAGLAGLSMSRGHGAGSRRSAGRFGERLAIISAARTAGAERVRAVGRWALGVAVAAPGRVLAVGLAVAVVGWGVGTRAEVVSDIRELIPGDLPELRDVDRLERATGVAGEVDVTVTAPDLTDPAVIAWMRDLKQRVLDRAGFNDATASCLDQDAGLCPSIALPDLFSADRAPPTRARARQVLSLLPPYFSQAVISRDPETGELGNTALITFGIKVLTFEEQKVLIDAIRSEIDPPGTGNDPPPGASAEVVGLPVLFADASSALSGNRYLLTVVGLLAVAVALLALYRSPRRALVPLIPVVLATGWSALGLALVGVPLNPMSATLGALVIAIATEFSVLLAARYEEERRAARSIGEALRRAYSRTGAAVTASGVTAIAGFAVLIASDIRMLRDFGVVTVVDLAVALLGVLVILPAALVWAESGFAPLGRASSSTRSASPPVSPGEAR